jgi:hypothetical protein
MTLEVSNVQQDKCDCYQITTPRATYLYDRQGCGFVSLIDKDGLDWISYHEGGGVAGEYRGIPNMAQDTFGHPGYRYGATSTLEQQEQRVRIIATSADERWRVRWDIFETHATMEALRIGAPVILHYEGTPGGLFRPAQQHLLLSDGSEVSCSEGFQKEIPAPKWIAVCDPSSGRSILLNYHGDSTGSDVYWALGDTGGMTVVGLGRADKPAHKAHIDTVPFKFSFGLLDSLEYAELASFALQMHQ